MSVRRLSHPMQGASLLFGLLAVLFGAVRAEAYQQTIEHRIHLEPSAFELQGDAGQQRLSFAGGAILEVEGAPELPMTSTRFVVPRGMHLVAVELADARWESMGRVELAKAAPLLSSDGERAEVEDRFGLGTTSGYIPSRNVSVGSNATLHGYSIAAVELVPARLAPDGTLERLVSARIVLTLELAGDEAERTRRHVAWPGRSAGDADEVAAVVENPNDVDTYAPSPGIDPTVAELSPLRPMVLERMARDVRYPVDYLIVTSAEYAPTLQALADFRTAEGIRTEVVTLDDIIAVARPGEDLQATLRNYLREAYEDWGLGYALLAGDSDLIPPRYVHDTFYPVGGATDIPTDLYFASFDGSWNDDGDGYYGEPYAGVGDPGDEVDMLAEISVGRSSIRNVGEAQNFVNKVIAYSDPADPSFVSSALFLSEVLFPAAWNGVDPIILDGAVYSEDIVFDSIIGGGNLMQSWRMYENNSAYIGAIPETKAAAMDSLQTGRFGLVNHIGHGFYYNMSVGTGSGNIFVSDAELLTNPNPFVIHALNCSSGAFDFDCLLERFVQIPAGAAASIGSSRAAFPQTADLYQQRFFYEIFIERNTRFGDAARAARTFYNGLTATKGSHRWTQFSYTVFGDPTMHIWRQAPGVPGLAYSSSVALGQSELTVNVSISGGATGALVGATRTDGGFAAATVDGLGRAVLDLGALSDRPGTIDLVLTGRNMERTEFSVPVAVGGIPHVRATAAAIVDDGSEGSLGDGDAGAGAGETVTWRFDFENNGGGGTAVGVSAQLVAVDAPGVTILDDTVVVGDIADGAMVPGATGFRLALDETVVDGGLLRFDVVSTNGSGVWSQPATLIAHAAEIEVARVRIDDSAFGNGNGFAEVGEAVDLHVELVNYGSDEARGLTALLTSSSANVTINVDTATWADLPMLTTAESVAPLQTIESDISVENWMTLTLTDSVGHVWTHQLELRPPVPPAAPTLITSLGPDRIGIAMEEPISPHFMGYRVYRRPFGATTFEEVTFDRVLRSGFYEDAGLELLTRYEYQVTVVDSSAIESWPSAPVSASTAPPELTPGYPVSIGRELGGPNAVADLLGNGSKYFVFGADWIYALDANGHEIIDGDSDSQTLGPIAGDLNNKRFEPSGVTVADLDGDGQEEIIASNFITKEIWVVRADGSHFPGWPQLMNQKSWATPAVGDLDNDGDLEIVVNNVGSRTYVWHHDGTDFFDGDANSATNGVFHVRAGETWNRSTPALFDVDGDGTLEILFGTHWRDGSDNFVYALKNDGTNAPGWPQNLGPGGFCVGHVTVADLDNDSVEEIMLITENWRLNIWHPDGSIVGSAPYVVESNAALRDSRAPATCVGDFDRDGTKEMVVVSTIQRDLCRIMIMDLDGSIWPGWPRSLPGLTESSPIIGDINGDFRPDILFGIGGGSDGYPNVLYAFNADGTDIDGFPITLGGPVRAVPVIDDFDQDGDVDILYAGFDLAAHVWDMPYPYNPSLVPWPTFQQNMHRTGVYADDRVTAALSADVSASLTVRGVLVESIFVGALSPQLRFQLERREVGAVAYESVAADLRVEGGMIVFVDATVEAGHRYEYRLTDASGAYEFRSGEVDVPVLRAALHGATPNPFNPSTAIRFDVPGVAGDHVPVRLEVFDVAGRRVRTLVSAPMSPGAHTQVWDGTDDRGSTVGSGVYFAVLGCAGQRQTMKMSLVK